MTEVPPSIQHFNAVKKLTEIHHDHLPPMPEKSAFMFHLNFYQSQK